MFRALCLAVTLAMTPAGASAQAAAGLPIPPGYEFIQVKGWELVFSDDDGLTFVMTARQPMHIWVRTEYKRARPSGTRSMRQLFQIDCNAGRTRGVTAVYFSASNLESFIMQDDETRPWIYPAPGTIGDIPLNILCD